MKDIVLQKGKVALDRTVKVCNVLASLSVVCGFFIFLVSVHDRDLQTATLAWSAVSNPKSGVSVARELEFLNKDTWFRDKSSFDNIHLVPESGDRGVSLKGLQLVDAKMTSLNADRAELSGASIFNTDMTNVSLKSADIVESEIRESFLARADLSRARIIESKIEGVVLGGATLEKALILDSTITASLPVVHVLNRETLGYDRFGRLRANGAFVRSSSIVVNAPEYENQCGVMEFDAAEFYYSDINAKVDIEEIWGCFLILDNGWLIGTTIGGKIGIDCEGCTIGYSDISIGSNLVAEQTYEGGNIVVTMNMTNFKDAWAFKSKISGTADAVDFTNVRFEKVDMRDLNPAGANISGTNFDNYVQSTDEGADGPDRLFQLFYRGYGQSQRSLNIPEEQFQMDVGSQETPEQVAERYPHDGFSKAWAWADRPPVGIPDGVAGPILCDPKLRIDTTPMNAGRMPEACGEPQSVENNSELQ